MKRIISVLLLCQTATAAALSQEQPAPKLSLPIVRAEVLAPTIVRFEAETPAGERVYAIDVQRQVNGTTEPPQRRMPLEGRSYKGSRWTGQDSVEAAQVYRYWFSANSGTTRPLSSDWTQEVIIKTPPAPTAAPKAAKMLSAKALGSYQVELIWQDLSDNEYGFEILEGNVGSQSRIALANPNTTRLIIHGRKPGSTSAYSVRSFNPVGISEATPPLSVKLPELRSQAGSPTAESCITREAAIRATAANSEEEHAVLDESHIVTLGGDWKLELMPIPGSCGNANCNWELYGTVNGCYRKLESNIFGVGLELIGKAPNGNPILLGIGHMGGMQVSYSISELGKSGLVDLDHFVVCEEPKEVATTLKPVFEECQFQQEIWVR